MAGSPIRRARKRAAAGLPPEQDPRSTDTPERETPVRYAEAPSAIVEAPARADRAVNPVKPGAPKIAAPRTNAAPSGKQEVVSVTSSPASGATTIIPEVIDTPLVPIDGPDPTKTALRRAMRQRAQVHADEAVSVLATALKSKDQRVAVAAANDILDRAYGKPTQEIDVDASGLVVQILKFGGDAA